jgi:hypothetical protein
MIDFPDSHYQYVKQRIKTLINSARTFGGIVQARDWPPKEFKPTALYLVLGQLLPIYSGRQPGSNSWFSPLYDEKFQWAWGLEGIDILPQAQMASRGNKYRTNYQIIQEVLQGMYPGFCEKKQWDIPNGTDAPQLTGTSYSPPEYIWWKKPVFTDKIDAASGILFSYAVSEFAGFAPEITF